MAPFEFADKNESKGGEKAASEKVMGTILWDADGCILTEFLQPEKL